MATIFLIHFQKTRMQFLLIEPDHLHNMLETLLIKINDSMSETRMNFTNHLPSLVNGSADTEELYRSISDKSSLT